MDTMKPTKFSKYRDKTKYYLQKYTYDRKHFGAKIAVMNFISQMLRLPLFPQKLQYQVQEKTDILIFNFLEQKYKDFINTYRNRSFPQRINSKKIWCCWRQGEQYAPEIVKICINNLRKHAWVYEVVIIHKENYNKYITLPDFILQKVQEQKISLTHLSDIIRMKLLKEYGGIWVDATFFVNQNIFSHFDTLKINSIYPKKHIQEHHQFTKRCSFFIGGESHRLFAFVYDLFIEYFSEYDQLISFFFLDFALALAYRNFSDCQYDIDKITLHNEELMKLPDLFNTPYEKEHYEYLMNIGYFKLTYKMNFTTHNKKGNLTYYGQFLKDYALL